MSLPALLCLILVFFLTAGVSVVTGGTSLITVPAMMELGVEPHVAVATNMLALAFLSLGGVAPFVKAPVLRRRRMAALVALTVTGSILGALFLVVVPAGDMPIVIATAMIGVALFSWRSGQADDFPRPGKISVLVEIVGLVLTFLLGIYGGFFSGGYVTLLTATCVACFRMTFLEAVAVTKLLNLFSSLVATAVFAARGLVHWRLGLILGAVSFVGGLAGAVAAPRLGDRWLRRGFVIVVMALALRTLWQAVRR